MPNQFQSAIQKLPNIAKYLLVFGVIIFISFLFPNNAKFKYQFVAGQTWHYDDLKAPFDFAILRPTEEVKEEMNVLEGEFSPYYEFDLDVARQKKLDFGKAFREQYRLIDTDRQFEDVRSRPEAYQKYGKDVIEKIYDFGIVELDPSHEQKGADFVINLLKGNTTQKQTLQHLLTPKKVELWVSDSLFDSRLQEPEFLLPLLDIEIFSPNVRYNDTLTKKFQAQQLGGISRMNGMVNKGDLIISKNGIITDGIYQKLVSFQKQYEREVSDKKSHYGVFFGYLLLTSLIICVFLLYLQYHAAEVFAKFHRVVFMLLWLVVFSYLISVIEYTQLLSPYMIPYCIVPIVIKNFYDEQLALFTHIVLLLIASFLCSLGYEFTFMQILAGIVAVLADFDTRYWSRYFLSIFFIFLSYAFAYFGLALIQEGNLSALDGSVFVWLFLNAFLTLLAYPLIPLMERVFGFTSNITLMELSDMNHSLLKELSIKAPGTLQHSLQVANLSEAAANQIGANALLVKVAAMYHDIGKALQPQYFIENQSGGNPHKSLSNLESARLIIEHVTEGVKLAKKHRLPSIIIRFIESHHGTTRVEYFYRNQRKDFPNEPINEAAYRYPGPKPQTKEEMILMMADSIEAASKSLKNPGEADIHDLVEKIVTGKIANGQFTEAALSFQELEVCKEAFKKLLKSIHHIRVEYPEAE
ncbi:MAG: HD family phosphohydrolase [Saprospiraceae bacterium]